MVGGREGKMKLWGQLQFVLHTEAREITFDLLKAIVAWNFLRKLLGVFRAERLEYVYFPVLGYFKFVFHDIAFWGREYSLPAVCGREFCFQFF